MVSFYPNYVIFKNLSSRLIQASQGTSGLPREPQAHSGSLRLASGIPRLTPGPLRLASGISKLTSGLLQAHSGLHRIWAKAWEALVALVALAALAALA